MTAAGCGVPFVWGGGVVEGLMATRIKVLHTEKQGCVGPGGRGMLGLPAAGLGPVLSGRTLHISVFLPPFTTVHVLK